MEDIFLPAIIMGILGLGFGLTLAWLAKKFAVEENPLVQKILDLLPGANCGACGYPGCVGLAEKIATQEAPMNACPVGGPKTWAEIARLLGNHEEFRFESKKAVLVCQGGKGVAQEIASYRGVKNCRAYKLLGVSARVCRYGCIGLGTCEEVCPFSAITMDRESGLPVISPEKCTGCGKCVTECPQGVLVLVPDREQVLVACVSKESGKVVRQACLRGCIKCQLCVKTCPEKAIRFEKEIIHIDQEKCTLCGLCVEKCPTHCLVRIFEESSVSPVSEAQVEVK